MLFLQVMKVAIFKLIYMIFVSQDTINVTLASHDGCQIQGKKANFVNIKISFMLLLQMNMVAIFKMRNKISDSWDNINVTLVSDDGRHKQAQL